MTENFIRLRNVYNPMGVVSFRLEDSLRDVFSRAGVNPAEVAKQAVEAEARRLDVEWGIATVRKYAAQATPLPEGSAAFVRRMRDERIEEIERRVRG